MTNELAVLADRAEPELRIGQVQWHCSEEDGGPDVGILLRIDADHHLWLGESISMDDIEGPLSLVVYGPDGKRDAKEFTYDDLREVIEDYIAPALRARSRIPTPPRIEE